MILTDAHTHIYRSYNLDTLVRAAFENVSKAADPLPEGGHDGLLFLTETLDNDCFDILKNSGSRASAPSKTTGQWAVYEIEENLSLSCSHSDFPGYQLFCVNGSQIVTKENIEVLALATAERTEDSLELGQTVESILGGGGIAVLPWGVGKWLGRRREIISSFLQETRSPLLFVGDNGSRPVLWPTPALLKNDTAYLPRVLSGSDPLPLPGEEGRIGGFGSIIDGTIDEEKPAASIREILADPRTRITGFGSLQSPFKFIKQQLTLRMR